MSDITMTNQYIVENGILVEEEGKQYLQLTLTSGDVVKIDLDTVVDIYTGGTTKLKKIKAVDPHIVVHGTSDKPYYAITYYDVSDKQWYRGSYGSNNLDYVFKQLKVHFEVITTKDEIIEAYEALTKGGYITIHDDTNNLITVKV